MEHFEPDPKLLERLARLDIRPWSGKVWRHTFADNPPDKTNGRGARWNPPGVEALYTSLDRATAIAEADHLIAVQPIRPRAKRSIHLLEIRLQHVLDLPDSAVLHSLGVDDKALVDDDHHACQALGGAAAFLHCDGLIVPSARSPGRNLVILFTGPTTAPDVQVLETEILDPG